MVKAGVELAFDAMVASGIYEESSAYCESLHELPLIANTIARKRLYEMNVVISDTAEYGNYLFSNVATPYSCKRNNPNLQKGDLVSQNRSQLLSITSPSTRCKRCNPVTTLLN